MLTRAPAELRLDDIRDGTDTTNVRVLCDPRLLGVLTQVRRTMDEEKQELLRGSILTSGQINPGIVAALEPAAAVEYLREMNLLWGKAHRLEDYPPVLIDGTPYHLFVVAGHCRHDAVLDLCARRDKGELNWTDKFSGKYRAEFRFGISVEEAIILQFQENILAPPPPHEQADAAYHFWRWRKTKEPLLTPAKFARDIGHTADWFKDAVRFCELPLQIQGYVWGASGVTIPYGALIHVSRLAENWRRFTGEDMSVDQMDSWLVRHVVLENKTAKEFGKLVSDYLRDRELEAAGQFSLFAVPGNGNRQGRLLVGEEQHHSNEVRRVVEPQQAKANLGFISYLLTVIRLMENGQLAEDVLIPAVPDDTFSPGSPGRQTLRQLELLLQLLPRLLDLLKKEPKFRHLIPDIVRRQEEVMALLDDNSDHEARLM
jgi:hypothetical protein